MESKQQSLVILLGIIIVCLNFKLSHAEEETRSRFPYPDIVRALSDVAKGKEALSHLQPLPFLPPKVEAEHQGQTRSEIPLRHNDDHDVLGRLHKMLKNPGIVKMMLNNPTLKMDPDTNKNLVSV